MKRLALAHVAALDAKAREIAEMSGALRRLAEHCEGNNRPDCPIIDDLADLILEKRVSATLRDVA